MVSEHLKSMLLNCKKQKTSDVLGDNNIFYAINFIFLDDIFNCFVDPNKEITIITYNFHIKRPTLQLTDKPFISTFIFEIFS